MTGCPTCGSELRSLPELYEVEVRKVEADPERLGRLAPPSSRAAIHGFILAVLAWMSLLVPFFAVNHFWRACGPIWGLTLIWIPLFLRARDRDRALGERHAARLGCAACGWIAA